MYAQHIVLSDHRKEWSNLRPLTLTKPIAKIRIGILSIEEKWQQYFEQVSLKTCQEYLQSFDNFSLEDESTFVNSSVLPTADLAKAIATLQTGESLYQNGVLLASKVGQSVGFEKEKTFNEKLLKINYCWDIFQLNEQAIALDFELLTKGKKSQAISTSNLIIGNSENVFLAEGAKVEGAILNPNGGYIYIGKNAEIMEGSVVRGSLALCNNAVLKLSTKIYGATTIGVYSKVGGEINNSVIQGYTNKGHDGFLGNSVLGEWCNLGADTNNSNLKNNYGNVKSWNYEQQDFIDSGLQFLGLVMGDHSKCGINTMFNTGTVVGVFANIFGGDFPPKYIPSFSWGGAKGFEKYQFAKAVEVAQAVMQRRNKTLNKTDQNILKYIAENQTI